MNKASLKQLTATGDTERLHPLSTTQEIAIGRESDCQILLDSTVYPAVSRRHAIVRPLAQAGSWEICDLKSANGTAVNGDRLQGCRKLQPGDRISLGQNVITFVFEVEEQRSPEVGDPPPIVTPAQTPAQAPAQAFPQSSSTPSADSSSGLSLSQLIPILSTGKDLRRKAFLLPGIATVIFVVSMFATIGNFVAFAGLLAAYLAGAGYFVIYQLCGKSKPWWLLILCAIATAGLLLTPLFSLFNLVFRQILPGNVASLGSNPDFFRALIAHFFGAGMFEELFKAIPVLAAYYFGSRLRSPWRERIGVREPLDGILLGAASAVGFTLLETLGEYVPNIVRTVTSQAGEGAGYFVGLQLLIPRILNSVFGHMAYSGYFGYFIGLSALKPSKRWTILTIGYFTAAGLHGFWNASGSIGSGNTGLFITTAVGVVAYAFLTAAILKARALSPNRSENFATRLRL